MIEELCKVLGPGEPEQRDLLRFRRVAEYEKDEDWPFNWLLINYVVRSILSHAQRDLTPGSYYKSPTGEAAAELKRLRAGAIGWLERCRALTLMDGVDPEAKAAFRSWWVDVVQAYERMEEHVSIYPTSIRADLGNAINHTIRCMAEPSRCARQQANPGGVLGLPCCLPHLCGPMLATMPSQLCCEPRAAESLEDADRKGREVPSFRNSASSDAGIWQRAPRCDRGASGGHVVAPGAGRSCVLQLALQHRVCASFLDRPGCTRPTRLFACRRHLRMRLVRCLPAR